MGASCISGGQKIVICKGQLSSDPEKFNSPYYGTVVMHPDSKTVDINLTCRIESVGNLDSSFTYFTTSNIKTLCGIKNLYIVNNTTAQTSSITPTGTQTGLTDYALMGRTGFVVCFNSAKAETFCIGRTYQGTGSLDVGGWPMNKENLIVVGRCFTIDIRGLMYD